MFDFQSYIRVLLAVSSALITLLGSVGIFVSLTVQRRIERLQDTLEEFMDLSYQDTANLTGRMHRLIEKYQMHYQLPDSPSKKILHYINLTIVVVIFAWFSVLLIDFRPPWNLDSLLYVVPLGIGIGILIFYRYLLKNAINPIGNSLFTPLIPPPSKLRSVSFLSKYVNVSVKTILKHARLRLVIKTKAETAWVVLKEELSFDDFLYYLELEAEKGPFFVGFGEISLVFPNEPITGKPVPALKNINIPLGAIPVEAMSFRTLKARLYIFPRSEKHPIEYLYSLQRLREGMAIADEPAISINYMITYQIDGTVLKILQHDATNSLFDKLVPYLHPDKKRRFWILPNPTDLSGIRETTEEVYVD